jgi:hypothetical protein
MKWGMKLKLAFLPSVPSLPKRSLVVVLTFGLLMLVMLSWKLAAHTRIELHASRVTFLQKHSQWIIAILNVIFAAGVAYLYKDM